MDIHANFDYSIHSDLLLYAVTPFTMDNIAKPYFTGKSTMLQM